MPHYSEVRQAHPSARQSLLRQHQESNECIQLSYIFFEEEWIPPPSFMACKLSEVHSLLFLC